MFMINSPHAPYFAFFSGLLVALGIGIFLDDKAETSHPIGYADDSTEVHVHSDFIVYLDGQQLDLSADKYMSVTDRIRHPHIHLHDGNSKVIHRHEHSITLSDFFESIGFTLTDRCITTDSSATYCSNENMKLLLFVNGQSTDSIAKYINQEEDQILLYYGDPDATIISELLSEVTDEACIYSGTCPERGTPPPEACGITCEL